MSIIYIFLFTHPFCISCNFLDLLCRYVILCLTLSGKKGSQYEMKGNEKQTNAAQYYRK